MKRPYTVIFSTITADGRLASSTRYSMLSCKYDIARQRILRGSADAVMIGANTAIIDNPTLRKRLEPRTRKYYRVVVDGKLRIPLTLKMLTPYPKTIIITAIRDPVKEEMLRARGVDVVVAGNNGVVDLEKALRTLYEEYGVEKLLVEGGGTLNYSLLSSRLVDEVRVTITPYIFASGVSFASDRQGIGFRDTSESPRLELVCSELCPCGRCVHIVYRVADARGAPVAKGMIEPCLSERIKRIIK